MDSDAQNPASTANPANLGAAREVRHGIRQAMGEIETALATAALGRAPAWSSVLADRLQVLRQAFDHHVELTESPTGFLSEIVDQAPRLAHAAENLRVEHSTIATAFERASAAVRSAEEGPDRVEDAREAVLDLLQQLARHRQHGADLVYEAYNVDIEGGDS